MTFPLWQWLIFGPPLLLATGMFWGVVAFILMSAVQEWLFRRALKQRYGKRT